MIFKKPNRKIHSVFIHCSASDHPGHDDVDVMRRWHRDRGWSDVGYHYFITKAGVIQEGRDLEKIPAAQRGHNRGSIAICLHGLRAEAFTDAQFDALRRLCHEIQDVYAEPLRFRGHTEVSAKSCPVFDYRLVLGLNEKGHLNAAFPEKEADDGVELPVDADDYLEKLERKIAKKPDKRVAAVGVLGGAAALEAATNGIPSLGEAVEIVGAARSIGLKLQDILQISPYLLFPVAAVVLFVIWRKLRRAQ